MDLASIGPQIAAGLTVLTPPVGQISPRCTVFGCPGADVLQAPTDVLSEWTAVRGDPDASSNRCQRGARRHEIASISILGVGLLANYVLAVILLGVLV